MFVQPGDSSGETKRPPRTREQRVRRDQRVLERLARASRRRTACRCGCARVTWWRPGSSSLDVEVDLARERRQIDHADADAPLDRLVALAARLQEAHVDLDLRVVAAHERLHLQVVEAVRVAGRVDDPERRRRRVLAGAGRVRVERVALEEQRVDELVDHRVAPARAGRRSRRRRSAGPARAWCARGRAASRPASRTKPLPG